MGAVNGLVEEMLGLRVVGCGAVMVVVVGCGGGGGGGDGGRVDDGDGGGGGRVGSRCGGDGGGIGSCDGGGGTGGNDGFGVVGVSHAVLVGGGGGGVGGVGGDGGRVSGGGRFIGIFPDERDAKFVDNPSSEGEGTIDSIDGTGSDDFKDAGGILNRSHFSPFFLSFFPRTSSSSSFS